MSCVHTVLFVGTVRTYGTRSEVSVRSVSGVDTESVSGVDTDHLQQSP